METIDEYILRHKKDKEKSSDFCEYLYMLMDKYNIKKASNIYLKANITKQCWSNIISGKACPSLNTCIKIALCMKLTNHECKYLLKKAGYTLASASNFALIIRYCFENKIYDIYKVNDILMQYGYNDFE